MIHRVDELVQLRLRRLLLVARLHPLVVEPHLLPLYCIILYYIILYYTVNSKASRLMQAAQGTAGAPSAARLRAVKATYPSRLSELRVRVAVQMG